MSQNLLSNIDVYGWQSVEDLVIAGLVLQANMLIIGEKGQGKTWLALRIAQAFDQAMKDEGKGGFPSTKIDGHSANAQDLVGYPFPPDDDSVREAIENDESPEMLMALSPNTVAGMKLIVIDETTRIDPHNQNRYLSLLDYGIVDGRDLEVQQIIGAANPVEYSGTAVMDEAFADRWRMRVEAPSFLDMPKKERKKAVNAQVNNLTNSKPDLGASKDLVSFVREARTAYEKSREANLAQVNDYVVEVVGLIDRALNGVMRSSDPDINVNIHDNRTTADIGTRRAGVILDNLFALHAVRTVRGEPDTLGECGRDALNCSLVHDLHGDQKVPQELLEVAHDLHGGILQSEEARVKSMIEATEDPVERVAKAMRLRVSPQDVSAYVREAHQSLKNDEVRRLGFSWVLFNRIQHGGSELSDRVNDNVMQLLVPDVKSLIEASENLEFTDTSVEPNHEAIGPISDLLQEVHRLRQTPEGRLTLALAEHSRKHVADTSTSPMSAASTAAKKYSGLSGSIGSAEGVVEDMMDVFTDLSRHEDALQ